MGVKKLKEVRFEPASWQLTKQTTTLHIHRMLVKASDILIPTTLNATARGSGGTPLNLHAIVMSGSKKG
jgi:hypothetical protein